jgi:GH35 family endo-1,4-beta-xylanase
MVVTWQLSDRVSWYRELSQRAPRPLPFDADLRITPLGEAMAAARRRAATGAPTDSVTHRNPD